MARKNKNKEIPSEIKVENKEGLTVSYDKDELKEKFPHLITEIAGKKKSVKIDSIENKFDLTPSNIEISKTDELIKPGAIDFLRRCTNNDDALKILNFLLKQKEISEKDYNSIKYEIFKGEGLKAFIEKHGGFKDQGYYEKKYRDLTRSKSKQVKN
jgi:hypothetical protein